MGEENNTTNNAGVEEKKFYISADEFLKDSVVLGSKVLDSGFKPDFVVAIWRGGTFPGNVVQEFLKYHGIETDHIAIRTSGRRDTGDIKEEIEVYGLDYLINNLKEDSKVLIVDDVFDSGFTLQEVIKKLKKLTSLSDRSEIRTATVYYKSKRNKSNILPDFYVHENNNWPVFPGEFSGLTREEIRDHKGEELARYF